jgi:hypothetical protein
MKPLATVFKWGQRVGWRRGNGGSNLTNVRPFGFVKTNTPV